MINVDCSVVIPAFNEEEFISKTIEHIQEAFTYCDIKGEVIVVDNNSTDSTAEIAKGLGAMVIHEPIQQIARARNTGAQHANASWLIFIDADTHMSPELLKLTLVEMRSEQVVGGGVLLKLDESTKRTQGFIDMWNRVSKTMKLAAGCYIFCLKSTFDEIGGFNEKVYASEEIWFIKRLKKAGKRQGLGFNIIEKERVVTSARKFAWFSPSMMALQVLIFAFFPFLCRFKIFCFLWYKRPKV